MSKGISLNIGINEVRKGFYKTTGLLRSPENDARAMAAIATLEGYRPPILLLTENATKSNFLAHFNECIKTLNEGDTLLLTFSGHGTQVLDTDNDEVDGKDEAWCLYDGHLVDDEIGRRWKEFKKGVKIIVVSSSCHSLTAIKDTEFDFLAGDSFNTKSVRVGERSLNRPTSIHKHDFDPEVLADIIHLSACDDKQQAGAGKYFSHFTDLLLKHWDYGRFKGTYEDLVFNIQKESGYCQKPGLRTLGSNKPYLQSKIPFKLN